MNEQDIIDFGNAISQADSSVRVAFQEKDDSSETDQEAAHFLKAQEKRVGRDLELYGFMGETFVGWQGVLPMLLEEVLIT